MLGEKDESCGARVVVKEPFIKQVGIEERSLAVVVWQTHN